MFVLFALLLVVLCLSNWRTMTLVNLKVLCNYFGDYFGDSG